MPRGGNSGSIPGDTTSDPTAPSNVPGPYFKGMVLDLTVNWTREKPSEEHVLMTITEAFDVSMSPAVEVQWLSSSGETRTAVLKLFDRRYGSRGHLHEYGHNPGVEACWQKYVQSGQAPGLFKYIEKADWEKGKGVWDICPFEVDEDTADTWETIAKKEGRLQYRALENWRNEIRAYEHLEGLQGKCVPLFFGTTSFSYTPAGSDPQYFQVGGILIQRISGFILGDLLDLMEASPDVDYQGLCQRAVEVAEEVNECGVINYDCKPRNMIVQTPTMRPFMIDFAQCSFREDFASDDEYNQTVEYWGNPIGFGGVVATRLNRVLKLGITIQYGPWSGNRVSECR
ncbi:hypothetical protein VM1G_00030 [Cytospora mali]|uniref:Protein kinase domain-containing protein n=1 Tax=Cytospora mali TaxID=578113 RepID=A0A194VN06_CYTMA|nr:hypothetical protein VM1G_00030 [Valsa mali]